MFERAGPPASAGRKQIATLTAHYFQKPAPLPEPIGVPIVAVAADPLGGKRDSAGGGGLRHHSPTEMLFAQLFAFAAAACEGQADEVAQWAQAVRRTTFAFEYFSSASEVEVLQKAIQAREDIKKNNEGMARTAMGRIFEIVAACDMMGKIGVVARGELGPSGRAPREFWEHGLARWEIGVLPRLGHAALEA